MFNKPNPKQNFFELEQEVLTWWKANQILEKSIDQRPEDNTKTFYDGPITANGEPHHGHMLTFAMKDIIPRYWTMKGYRVSRSLGWDCQGIPVEYEIEKKLGFKEKKDIEKFGIAKFNNLCRESVLKHRESIIELEELMGRLTNSDEEYATMDPNFIESIWWSLKELYGKGLLYEGFKVVPYSTRAGTTLSNAEVALGGYKPYVDPAITVEFPLEDDPNTALLAWTTTPWTIPSNLGIAVGKKISYVKVKTKKSNIEFEKAWLVKDLPEDVKKAKSEVISQAYLEGYTDESGLTIKDARVRKVNNTYTFTVKHFAGSESETGQVLEKTEEITKEKYIELVKTATKKVTKTRYYYPLSDSLTAEIDVYMNNLQGLTVIEIEFPSLKAEKEFITPDWFGKEVSDSKGIYPIHIANMTIDDVNALNDAYVQEPHNWEASVQEVTYIVAKELVEKIFKGRDYEVIETIDSESLIGKKYIPPYNYFVGRKNAHQVYEGFHVTTESGTGLVHLAPYGAEDNEIFQQVGIEAFDYLDDQGDFNELAPDYQGMNYREANGKIKEDLKAKGVLFFEEDYEHDMPMCWRTKTPLIYKPITSWYIAMSTLRDKLVEYNNRITWVPSHVKEGRFGNWLAEIKDWGISRLRYWGTPLPVWKSESGKIKIIGSFAELEELSGKKLEDPHKPFVDEITFEIDGELYTRIPDVIDVWYDSGAMPFARFHYPFENEEKFQKKFPADYIAESVDQTRGWFYTLHALGTAIFDIQAFNNVVMSGFVLDDEGVKLSKSKGNYTSPKPMIQQHGADTIRLNFFATPISMGEDTTVTDRTLKLQKQETMLPLWNIFSYLVTYANIHGWTPREELAYNKRNVTADEHPWDHIPFDDPENNLDAWLLYRLQETIRVVTTELDNYLIPRATRAMKDLISETSKWYIRNSRDRFAEGDTRALETLYYVLVEIAKLLAPFTPFIAEHIYRELVVEHIDNAVESVHLCDYPHADKKFLEEYSIVPQEMSILQKTVEMGHILRTTHERKVRQPLSTLFFKSENKTMAALTDWMEDLLKAELNVLTINEAFQLEETETIKVISDENLSITVGLDIEISEELRGKGLLREIIRNIQATRKNMNFSMGDSVHISYRGDEEVVKIIQNNMDELKAAVTAKSIEGKDELENPVDLQINGCKLQIAIK